MNRSKKLTATLLITISILSVVFSSCRKCLRCETKTASGQVVESFPETCGRKKTLDVQELNYRASIADTLTLDCNRE